MIDLRSDPGGMLSTVVDMCDYLLPAGKIVYQEDKNGNVYQRMSLRMKSS